MRLLIDPSGEPQVHAFSEHDIGAGEGDRTLDPHVGNVMLYR